MVVTVFENHESNIPVSHLSRVDLGSLLILYLGTTLSCIQEPVFRNLLILNTPAAAQVIVHHHTIWYHIILYYTMLYYIITQYRIVSIVLQHCTIYIYIYIDIYTYIYLLVLQCHCSILVLCMYVCVYIYIYTCQYHIMLYHSIVDFGSPGCCTMSIQPGTSTVQCSIVQCSVVQYQFSIRISISSVLVFVLVLYAYRAVQF